MLFICVFNMYVTTKCQERCLLLVPLVTFIDRLNIIIFIFGTITSKFLAALKETHIAFNLVRMFFWSFYFALVNVIWSWIKICMFDLNNINIKNLDFKNFPKLVQNAGRSLIYKNTFTSIKLQFNIRLLILDDVPAVNTSLPAELCYI